MFRLSKHRAKLREMLFRLGIYKYQCVVPGCTDCSSDCHELVINSKSSVMRKIAEETNTPIINVPLSQFDLSTCNNGTTQCLIPIKCIDARRCPYGK